MPAEPEIIRAFGSERFLERSAAGAPGYSMLPRIGGGEAAPDG